MRLYLDAGGLMYTMLLFYSLLADCKVDKAKECRIKARSSYTECTNKLFEHFAKYQEKGILYDIEAICFKKRQDDMKKCLKGGS